MISKHESKRFERSVKSGTVGFAMVEVLITLLILASGLLVLAKFQIDLIRSNALAGQRTEAVMLAQQKIETMRSFATLTAYSGISAGSDNIAGGNASYARTWSVVDHTTAPLFKEVACTVTWADSAGEVHSVSVTSYIASEDPKIFGSLIMG